MDIEILNALLTPKSVAVIGASARPGKIGHTVLNNIIKVDTREIFIRLIQVKMKFGSQMLSIHF